MVMLTAVRRVVSSILLSLCFGAVALGQGTTSGDDASVTTIESEPLRCWLKSSKAAVHMGEQFALTLTCAVVETVRAVVLPDFSRLEPGAIELAPFEVLSGRRHEDIRSGIWRYFQYEYTVRFVADGFFGEEIILPPVRFGYRVSIVGDGNAQEGRERTYVLPQLPIKILSLVPAGAADIRDVPHETFARIAERQRASSVALVVAGILYAFAAVLAALTLVRAANVARGKRRVRERPVSSSALATAALLGLRKLRESRQAVGWTPALATQALALARIAAALLLERPIAHVRAEPGTAVEDGQLLVDRGLLRRRPVLLSASVTPPAVTAAARERSPARRAFLDEIGAALEVLSDVRYARLSDAAVRELDEALEQVTRTLLRARILSSWPVRVLDGLRRTWQSWGLRWAS